jgi:glucose-6-phosphate-specific signal transduction histidine kinase
MGLWTCNYSRGGQRCVSPFHLCIEDDGIGGADPGNGSGLLGLIDRVEALGAIWRS